MVGQLDLHVQKKILRSPSLAGPAMHRQKKIEKSEFQIQDGSTAKKFFFFTVGAT